jgi:hypothetical protein
MDDTSTRLMETLPAETIKLCENVHEVTCVAEHLLKAGQIAVNDSRDLFWESLEIARKFEAQFDAEGGDYLSDIELYAENSLKKAFPPEPCENENIFFRLPDGTVIQAQLCGDAANPEGGNGWASIDIIAILPGGYPETLCAVDYETCDPISGKSYNRLRVLTYDGQQEEPVCDQEVHLQTGNLSRATKLSHKRHIR